MTIGKKLRVCLALLAGLATTSAAFAQDLIKIKIAISSPSIPASTARIIKQMGLFEKHGLDATITMMDSGNVAAMSMLSGSVNFSVSAPTDVIVARARGQDVVALTTAYHGNSAVMTLSKALADKSGVSPTAPLDQRLKALDGLTIAAPSPTSTYTISLKAPAEKVGAKIKFVFMGQPEMVAALQSGAIQGYVSGAPFYARAVTAGTGVIWINGPKGETPPEYAPSNVIVVETTRAYAAAHADIVKRLVDSFLDFGQDARERPLEVKAAVAKLYPDIDPKLLDVFFDSEVHGFAVGKLTEAEMAHDMDFTRGSGIDISSLNGVSPATMMFP